MLNTISVVNECRIRNKKVTDHWIERIYNLMQNSSKIRNVLDSVPDEFISEPARDFAMAFLNESVRRLKGLQNE